MSGCKRKQIKLKIFSGFSCAVFGAVLIADIIAMGIAVFSRIKKEKKYENLSD